MKNSTLTNLIVLSSVLSLGSASVLASPETPQQMINEMHANATKPEYLPKGRSVIIFGKQSNEALVVSDNPRWVVKGELFDMWQNKKIANLSELHEASEILPLNTIKVDIDNVLSVTANSEKDLELTVFLDPFKSTTPKDVETLLKYASAYQLKFILFTKNKSKTEVKRLFTLACNLRGQSVNKQLAIIMNQESKVDEVACEQEKVVGSYGLTSILGIDRSPTLISSSYRYSEGLPERLTTWLMENMK
jgi:thiol:disulfide interchange protein DsbC